MAPKRQKVGANETSSLKPSSKKFDSKKSVSLEASKRGKAYTSREIIKERRFICPSKVIQSMVNKGGWETLVKQPNDVIAPIIREIYAKASKSNDEKLFVRGQSTVI